MDVDLFGERVCLALISLITVSKVFALLQFDYRLQNQTDFQLRLSFLSIVEDTYLTLGILQ